MKTNQLTRDPIKAYAKETLQNVESLVKDGTELRQQRGVSLILANLSPDDFQRFQDARISYSGSTGPNATGYGDLHSYIATDLSELNPATHALGWNNFTVEAKDNQWIVRKDDAAR